MLPGNVFSISPSRDQLAIAILSFEAISLYKKTRSVTYGMFQLVVQTEDGFALQYKKKVRNIHDGSMLWSPCGQLLLMKTEFHESNDSYYGEHKLFLFDVRLRPYLRQLS